jgi:V/A-type H+-transporting ATPase subunit E
MKRTLEKGPEKIQVIVDLLKKETLEPAKVEAETLIAEARAEAARIIEQAHKEAEELHTKAHAEIARERNVFQSALAQASKQTIEVLRQHVESELFNPQLVELISSETKDPKIITNLLKAIVEALNKEGLDANLSAIIPKIASPEEINALLGENIIKKLKEKSVILGGLSGGVKVKLNDKQLTLDLSENALIELIANYVRKDFRKLLFAV